MNSGPCTQVDPAREFESLNTLGALPPHSELATYSTQDSPAAGLLAAWKEWLRTAPKSRRSRAARIHSALAAAITAGAELTFVLPGRAQQLCERWLGERAYWWSNGIVDTAGVGIVSSRLSRDASVRATVLRALRLSMAAVEPASERVIASRGTSLCEYIEPSGEMLDLPLLRVSASSDQTTSKPWIEELIQAPASDAAVNLLVSPSIAIAGSDAISTDHELDIIISLPTRDRVLALLSHRLFVMKLRRGGNWWKILQAGSADELWQPGAVRVVPGPGLCPDDVVSDLENEGAVRWLLKTVPDSDDENAIAAHPSADTAGGRLQADTVSNHIPEAEAALIQALACPDSSEEWLIHWTRAAEREWAHESQEDYLNSILLDSDGNSRAASGTLERIVQGQVIRATPGNTRTSANAVCLSAVPLARLITQRVYRRHRGRWDFEHYGIGIRKRLIHSLGGRPVIYGDESTWQSLPEGERLWFQLEQSQSATETIDWTTEIEWRLPTDLRLDNLPTGDVFVYCATEQEAIRLRTICPWRVVSVEVLTRLCGTTAESGGK